MLATERRAATVRLTDSPAGAAAGTDAWAVGNASCPDDCHYCSGPETD
jgi:hypothetical protein